MGFYDEMRDTASEILSEFAQGAINLVKAGNKTGDPWKPTTGTPTTVPLKATAKGVALKYISSGVAVAGDVMVTASANSEAVPDMADSVTIDGVRFKIVSIERVPAAGTTVVYILICRKS